MAQKVIGKWTDKLRDPWDVRDLYSVQDGYPWCNSHYGRQLIFWAIPLALSGQQYDAALGRLSLIPKPAHRQNFPGSPRRPKARWKRLPQGGRRIQSGDGCHCGNCGWAKPAAGTAHPDSWAQPVSLQGRTPHQ